MVIAHRPQIDPLEHPQGVRSAKYQCTGRCKTQPEIDLDRAQDHHPFAHETGGCRQAAIGHREQQGKRSKLGHGVDDTTVVRDLARMHTVIQHADAKEHGAGHEAVRNHLHQTTGHADVIEDEEA